MLLKNSFLKRVIIYIKKQAETLFFVVDGIGQQIFLKARCKRNLNVYYYLCRQLKDGGMEIVMKIVVITGSPHNEGTSFLLTERFISGAKINGNEIIRFDVGSGSVHPCTGCDYCLSNDGKCVFRDPMDQIIPAILQADLIVLSTPLYYFGMPAQIKAVIDRLYAFNDQIIAHPAKALLLATCGDNDDWVLDALLLHYKTLCRYLKWDSVGYLVAPGVYTRSDLAKTTYPDEALRLGKTIV